MYIWNNNVANNNIYKVHNHNINDFGNDNDPSISYVYGIDTDYDVEHIIQNYMSMLYTHVTTIVACDDGIFIIESTLILIVFIIIIIMIMTLYKMIPIMLI